MLDFTLVIICTEFELFLPGLVKQHEFITKRMINTVNT